MSGRRDPLGLPAWPPTVNHGDGGQTLAVACAPESHLHTKEFSFNECWRKAAGVTATKGPLCSGPSKQRTLAKGKEIPTDVWAASAGPTLGRKRARFISSPKIHCPKHFCSLLTRKGHTARYKILSIFKKKESLK